MRRLAVLSLHTSPLAQPGTGDGGGMNVYVRELTAALARSGVTCDVFTRAWSAGLPAGRRRRARIARAPRPGRPGRGAAQGVPARASSTSSPPGCSSAWPPRPCPAATRAATCPTRPSTPTTGSRGLSGHVIKHELNLPLVCTFHTLDRVKAESMPEEVEADMPHRRAEAEASVIDCSDAVLASCTVEADQIASLYGGEPSRIRIVPARRRPRVLRPRSPPPGAPRPGPAARWTPAALRRPDPAAQVRRRGDRDAGRAARRTAGEPYRLVVVGGPSGPHGEKSLQGLHDVADARGVREHVHFVDPQPHELLSSYYRAADVCLVPSRSESFGLVALEAAACGTPVVASAVGGLTTLVDHGHTGFLVDDPDPRRVRRRGAPGLRRAAGGRALLHRLGAAGPPLHLARRRPRRWWSCTTSWPRAASSSAAEPARPEPAGPTVPDRRPPRGGGDGRRGGLHRRLGRARAGRRRLPGGRRAPGGHRPHGVVPLVPPLQGRREGLHHRLVHPQAAHAALRGPVHAGPRDQPGRGVRVPAAPQRPPLRHVVRPGPRGRRVPGGPGTGPAGRRRRARSDRRLLGASTPTTTSRRP